jgi:glycosyltransferase involved in cell wall biosynthesis
MKVLHIIDSAGLYGAEMVVLALMEEQRQQQIEPILCSIGARGVPEKAIEAEARQRGLTVKPFRMMNGPNLAGVLAVMRYCRTAGVEIMHSHGYKGNILFGFLPRGLRQIPLVTTIHGWSNRGGLSKIGLYEWLDGLVLARLDGVVAVSQGMTAHPRLAGRPGLPLRVIKNAVPRTERQPVHELDQEILSFCKQRVTIGSIGRLSPDKGQALLLHALSDLNESGSDLGLVILGEGPERKTLERLIDRLQLQDRVRLPGFRSAARDYLPEFGLFALPSFTEGLPITLLETMQCGTPIVASRVGGIPELLDGGQAGLLIEPGDAAGLTAAIRQVVDAADDARLRADRAREIVELEYTSERMVRRYSDLYASVLSSTVRGGN